MRRAASPTVAFSLLSLSLSRIPRTLSAEDFCSRNTKKERQREILYRAESSIEVIAQVPSQTRVFLIARIMCLTLFSAKDNYGRSTGITTRFVLIAPIIR